MGWWMEMLNDEVLEEEEEEELNELVGPIGSIERIKRTRHLAIKDMVQHVIIY
jgi:hypothetical protein